MSRSSKSFASLYDYFCKDDDVILRGFNIFSNVYNKDEVIKEFLENAQYLKTARGKNYLYHEIISLKENDLNLDEQREILEDLALKYLSLRAENHLGLMALHSDKGHIHIHLMISSNRISESKRTRLSKKKFHSIQQSIERYTNQTYPQLEPTSHYLRDKNLKKDKRAEQELKHKRGKTTKKEQLKTLLKEAFEKANSTTYLKNYFKDLNIEFYIRGLTTGVIFEKKKYRLKTLGVEDLYFKTLRRLV
jgi:phosphoenolpyruvate carboxylase